MFCRAAASRPPPGSSYSRFDPAIGKESKMNIKTVVASMSLAMLLCAGPIQSQDVPASLSRADIEKIVREYILQHPEVLMESVQGHRDRERADAQRPSRDAVGANRRDLFDDPASPRTGAADAEVAIVQFFDYKCGYCRRVSPTLSKLLEKHKNVQLIYKELPILGPDSHLASLAALAAEKQGAYQGFHRELMSLNGPITTAVIEGIGRKLGLDVERLKADMNTREVEGALTQNQRLAGALGVQSTPSFVIGGELVTGAMELARFEELISKSRNQ
jgi:protein-disulfide isomerase